MKRTKADITLLNNLDLEFARDGYIKAKDIRAIKVKASVDTGVMPLVIPEEICKKLGLQAKEEKFTRLIDGQRLKCKVADSVRVRWKNREWSVEALVVPGAEEVLLSIQGDDVEYYLSNFVDSVKAGVKS